MRYTVNATSILPGALPLHLRFVPLFIASCLPRIIRIPFIGIPFAINMRRARNADVKIRTPIDRGRINAPSPRLCESV